MPHTALILGATILATAATHIAGADNQTVTEALYRPNTAVVSQAPAKLVTTSERKVLRSTEPQRWVF